MIARAGAHFVNLVGWLGIENLGHEGDIVRWRDRLPFADRNRFIVVSLALGLRGQELMAGYRAKGLEHARVLDVPLGQVPLDHPIASRGSTGRPRRPACSCSPVANQSLAPTPWPSESSPRPHQAGTTPFRSRCSLPWTISLHSMIAAGSSLAQGLAAHDIILHRTRLVSTCRIDCRCYSRCILDTWREAEPVSVDEVSDFRTVCGFDLAAKHEHHQIYLGDVFPLVGRQPRAAHPSHRDRFSPTLCFPVR